MAAGPFISSSSSATSFTLLGFFIGSSLPSMQQ
jgi:hypothetical protein